MLLPRVYATGSSVVTSALVFDIAKIPYQPTVPNIVFLLQDSAHLANFTDQNSKLTVFGKIPDTKQFMASCAPPKLATGKLSSIDNLIVGEVSNKFFSITLQKYKCSLRKDSNVLLINPGFGLLELINKNIWTKEDERPNIFLGNIDNELDIIKPADDFALRIDRVPIPLSITKVPSRIESYSYLSESPKEWVNNSPLMQLIKKLNWNQNDNHIFKPSFFQYGDFMLIKFERLLVESCVEPLAMLLECELYGELLNSPFFFQMVDDLLAEQMHVLNITYPYLRNVKHYDTVFHRPTLKKVIQKHLHDRRFLTPSMLKKHRLLNKTNINQLTGYFVGLATYKRISIPQNELILRLVRGKVQTLKDKPLTWDL